MGNMREVVQKSVGREQRVWDPEADGMVYILEGTPDALKLRVVSVGTSNPGHFGRHLESGKVYSLHTFRPEDLDEDEGTGMVDYVVPDKEKRPGSWGGAQVVIQITSEYIIADLDS